MNHWIARRRLPDLLEGGLAPETEAGLRRHAAGCRRCRRRLARLEAADALLRRLPRALVPLEAGGAVDARLATLAQWDRRPAGGAPYGRLEAASALATVALMVVLAASVSDWAPVVGDLGTSATVAYVVPDAPMTPLTFR